MDSGQTAGCGSGSPRSISISLWRTAVPEMIATADGATPAHRATARFTAAFARSPRAGGGVPQGAKRHRPSLLGDRGDVVLPLCSRRAGQDVCGTGLEGEFGGLPGAGLAAAKSHPARGQQRDATATAPAIKHPSAAAGSLLSNRPWLVGSFSQRAVSAVLDGAGGFWYGSGDEGRGLS